MSANQSTTKLSKPVDKSLEKYEDFVKSPAVVDKKSVNKTILFDKIAEVSEPEEQAAEAIIERTSVIVEDYKPSDNLKCNGLNEKLIDIDREFSSELSSSRDEKL